MAMKDRSKQLSKQTWKDPTRSLSRLAKIESKLVGLFRNYRKQVLAELQPAEHPFTQMEPLVHGGPGSGNFGHAGRPGEVGGSGPGGGIKAIPTADIKTALSKSVETAWIIDQGKVIDVAVGDEKEVSSGIDPFEKVSVHTHPTDLPPSPGDIETFYKYNLPEMTVITKDSAYIVKDPNFKPSTSRDAYYDWQEANGRLSDVRERIADEMRGEGKTPLWKDAEFRTRVWETFAKSEGFEYSKVPLSSILEETHTQKAPQWPVSFSIEHFYQRLEDLTTQELIGPANAILEKEIPDAFTHGTKYADLNLKAKMGIKLGAPLEERQRAWQKVGALVEKSKGEFKGVSDAVNQQIRRAVADGMVNEDSLSTVTKRIQEVAESVGENRARMIARTETMKAINTGVKDRYARMGIERVEWLAAEDERTCEVCGELDGQIFDIDKAPECPAHPLCRCTLTITEESLGLSEDEEEATQKRPHTCSCGHEQITGGQGRFL